MSLIPVDFGTPHVPAPETDRGDALEFTPTALTILSA
jgi:hypothetical protein